MFLIACRNSNFCLGLDDGHNEDWCCTDYNAPNHVGSHMNAQYGSRWQAVLLGGWVSVSGACDSNEFGRPEISPLTSALRIMDTEALVTVVRQCQSKPYSQRRPLAHICSHCLKCHSRSWSGCDNSHLSLTISRAGALERLSGACGETQQDQVTHSRRLKSSRGGFSSEHGDTSICIFCSKAFLDHVCDVKYCFCLSNFAGLSFSFFPQVSEGRVLLIVEVYHHIFSSSHLLIFKSSHLHIF